MIRRPPRSTRTDTLFPYTTLFRSYTLRRLAARAETNGDGATPMLAIGMSATLGDPAEAWRRLVGRDEVFLLAPAANERTSNPRGREYFYFIQPEVESRGQDIAGASTTIQSLMCLSHGMRRRSGKENGRAHV